jgi:hypothetical protein
MADEGGAHTLTLTSSAHAGMPDEIDVANSLDTHHSDDSSAALKRPKGDSPSRSPNPARASSCKGHAIGLQVSHRDTLPPPH